MYLRASKAPKMSGCYNRKGFENAIAVSRNHPTNAIKWDLGKTHLNTLVYDLFKRYEDSILFEE